ncbi:neutral zinc metallopeptidase [Spiractinospora alimapuensis]|nr:neutral zinc metallopeptidase [Spiractinospora alimapuensis]
MAEREAQALRASAPRPAFGVGLLSVVTTGLAAAGIAGFAVVATFMGDDGADIQRVSVASSDTSSPTPVDDIDREAAADLVEANPLYGSGQMEPGDCDRPDLDTDDPESMAAFLHGLTDCMDETWEDQFEDGDSSFHPPVRHFWTVNGQSPCGRFPSADRAAFYCEMNQGLYLGVEDIVQSSHDSEDWESYAMLLSHEYAHHVQSEAGIISGYRALRAREGDSARGESWTRRNELQANCFGGAFLGTLEDSLPIDDESREELISDARARGDSDAADRRTHGTPDNGELWANHGFDRMDPAACNTWDARDELVE